ncbi:MAG: transcriptional regulator, partial [Thermoplasmatales archaeon]
LESKSEDTFQEIEDNLELYYGAVNRSLEGLKNLGLVVQDIDNSTRPPSNIIRLTEKGKLIAQKLKEVEEILKEVND